MKQNNSLDPIKLGRVAVYLGEKLKRRLDNVRRRQTPIPPESRLVRQAVEEFVMRSEKKEDKEMEEKFIKGHSSDYK